ncbi:MAG: hypothetical protein WA435_13690 [Gallionellaceae bacterium]
MLRARLHACRKSEVVYAGMVADKPPEVSKAEVTGKLARLKAMLNQSI